MGYSILHLNKCSFLLTQRKKKEAASVRCEMKGMGVEELELAVVVGATVFGLRAF